MTHPFIANRRFLVIYLSVLIVIGLGIFLVLALNNPVPGGLPLSTVLSILCFSEAWD